MKRQFISVSAGLHGVGLLCGTVDVLILKKAFVYFNTKPICFALQSVVVHAMHSVPEIRK